MRIHQLVSWSRNLKASSIQIWILLSKVFLFKNVLFLLSNAYIKIIQVDLFFSSLSSKVHCTCSGKTVLRILGWCFCAKKNAFRWLIFCLNMALKDQNIFRHGDVLVTLVKTCGHCSCLNFFREAEKCRYFS